MMPSSGNTKPQLGQISNQTNGNKNAKLGLGAPIDAEIAALETKLTQIRSIKQGMMHELLTGKTRLI